MNADLTICQNDVLYHLVPFCDTVSLIRLSRTCQLLWNNGDIWDTLVTRYGLNLNEKKPEQSKREWAFSYLKAPIYFTVYLINQIQKKTLSLNRYQITGDPQLNLDGMRNILLAEKIITKEGIAITLTEQNGVAQPQIELDMEETCHYANLELTSSIHHLPPFHTDYYYDVKEKMDKLIRAHPSDRDHQEKEKEWSCLAEQSSNRMTASTTIEFAVPNPRGGPFGIFDTEKDLQSWTWKTCQISTLFPNAQKLKDQEGKPKKLASLPSSILIIHVKT